MLVSSGAIATGLPTLKLTRRPRDLATQQAAASVGQGVLLAHYSGAFARHGRTVGQVLLTAEDVTRRAHYRNAQRTLYRLLELGVVPIVNENDTVATDEIRFGDNDRLAALVAHLVHADLLVLLSDVDGLYDGPPSRAGSRLLAEVRGEDDLAERRHRRHRLGRRARRHGHQGRGRAHRHLRRDPRRADLRANRPARRSAGDPVGTLFHPTGSRTRHAAAVAGARHGRPRRARARPRGGRRRRTPTPLAAARGRHRGRRRASSPEIRWTCSTKTATRWPADWSTLMRQSFRACSGRSTRELARELGPAYEREVVHRDDLVILRH